MITRELEVTFNLAVREAEKRRHELICLEHLLYAMCHDARAIDILKNCGADLQAIKDDLDDYLNKLGALAEGERLELEQTLAVTRVLRRAAIHVQSSGKKEIDACSLPPIR